MEFTVFQNEHPQGRNMSGSGLQDGILRINRIRLVLADSGDTNNAGWGTGATEPTAFPTGRDPITKQGHGYEVDDGWATNTERWTPNADAEIEIRTAQALALPIRMSNGNISATEEYTIENNQPIPENYRFKLFKKKDEIELLWNGKSYDTTNVSLPFQIIEHVDEPREEKKIEVQGNLFDERGRQLKGWTNKLIWGNNSLVLSSLINGPLRKEIEVKFKFKKTLKKKK